MSKWLHKLPKKLNNAPKAPKKVKEKQPKAAGKIEDLDRYRQSLKLRKWISLILAGCTIVILVIVLATAFFTGKFTEFFYHFKQLSAEDQYPVTIKEQSFSDAEGMDRYLSIMTRNGVIFLDEKGEKADEAVLGYSSPVMKNNQEAVMIYDHSGNQFCYAKPFEQGFTIETEKKIITGAISKEGNCAIATYHDRYAAEVTVYHTDGSVSYRWYSASDKVISLAFDDESNRLYVCCINANGGFLKTIVYALNLNSEKEIYRTTLSNSVSPYYMQPMSDGGLAVVTTGSIEFLDKDGATLSATYYYSDLYAVDGSGKYLALAQKNINNNTTSLLIYNASGDRIASTELNDVPYDMHLTGTNLYCLTDDNFFHWSFSKNENELIDLEEHCSGMAILGETVFLYSNNTVSRMETAQNTSKK